jgi:hypothetical protein
VTANLTYDGTEARWKALQASGLYERRSYLTEVYRNALAREVRALGYEIENRRDAAGKDKGFEIAGVSHLLYQFATGGISCHLSWPSCSENRMVHWLSFNFLQPSRVTAMMYPLLVLP